MIFQPEHIDQIRTGEKTVTRRRWRRKMASEGNVYMATTSLYTSHTDADCYIRVTDVYDEPLGELTPEHADREGGYTVDEFEALWCEIYDEWNPADVVTVVEFEYVGDSLDEAVRRTNGCKP